MIKKISLDKTDEKVKKFFKKLKTEQDQYILEIEGKPVIGEVPPWRVSEQEENRKKLLSMLEEVWAKTKDIPEEEVEKIVHEAVTAAMRTDDQSRS